MAPGGNLLLFDACSQQKCIAQMGQFHFSGFILSFELFLSSASISVSDFHGIWMTSSISEIGQYLVGVNAGCSRCQLLHHQHSVCLVVLVKQVKKDLEMQLPDFSAFSTFVNCGNFSTVLTQMSFVFACLQRPSHLILARFDIRSFNKNWDCALNDTKI